MLKKIGFGLVGIILLGYIFLSYALSNRVLNPNSSDEKTKKSIVDHWGTTYEDMMSLLPKPTSFTAAGEEEALIAGKYFQVSDSAKCVFIFSHGWGMSWPNMLKYYPAVSSCNCNVVMYDHRSHGESSSEPPTGGIKEAIDLLKVTKWVEREKGFTPDQIAWLGSSWGATAALIAGADQYDVALIIADAPFQNWYSAVFERAIKDYGNGIKLVAPGVMQVVNWRTGINCEDASALKNVSQITEPVLLIHSQGDLQTNSQQSVQIAKGLKSTDEFHHTDWGNDHVKDVINNTEDISELISAFIAKQQLVHFQTNAISNQ